MPLALPPNDVPSMGPQVSGFTRARPTPARISWNSPIEEEREWVAICILRSYKQKARQKFNDRGTERKTGRHQRIHGKKGEGKSIGHQGATCMPTGIKVKIDDTQNQWSFAKKK